MPILLQSWENNGQTQTEGHSTKYSALQGTVIRGHKSQGKTEKLFTG